jgi:hypothetical protein
MSYQRQARAYGAIPVTKEAAPAAEPPPADDEETKDELRLH